MDRAKELGRAVIYLAYRDAHGKDNTYQRRTARNFLCGIDKVWLDSLRVWSDVAGIDYHNVISVCRKKWMSN